MTIALRPARTPYALLFLLLVPVALATALQVRPNFHAWVKHGDDAVLIRNCLDRDGPTEIWRKFNGSDRFVLLCKMDDGRYGLQIVQQISTGSRRIWAEVTSFVRGNGTYQETVRYLCEQATRWKGGLP